MNRSNPIKSVFNIKIIVLLIIGGMMTSITGLYFIIVVDDLLSKLVIGFPIIWFGVYCFYCLLSYDILHLSKSELVINSIVGKTKRRISLSKIITYTEIEKENGALGGPKMKWQDLTIYTNNQLYKISSSTYTNYRELRKGLIKGLKKDKRLEQKWQQTNNLLLGYGFVIVAIVLGSIIFRHGIDGHELTGAIILIGIILFPLAVGLYLIMKARKPAGNIK